MRAVISSSPRPRRAARASSTSSTPLDRWLKDPRPRPSFSTPTRPSPRTSAASSTSWRPASAWKASRRRSTTGTRPPAARRKIQKDPPPVLMTNPDMLHLAFLAYPENWEAFMGSLVPGGLDEAHVYRGIFGAHVHHVLWRFQRLLAVRGAAPVLGRHLRHPRQRRRFFKTLMGREASVIEESGAPRPGRRLFLMTASGSPYTLACDLMDRLLQRGRPDAHLHQGATGHGAGLLLALPARPRLPQEPSPPTGPASCPRSGGASNRPSSRGA